MYAIESVGLAAGWWLLLTPLDKTRSMLEFIFAPDYEYRDQFIVNLLLAACTPVLAIVFMLRRTESKPLAAWLFLASVVLLTVAFQWRGIGGIFNYGFACAFALLSWRRPDLKLH